MRTKLRKWLICPLIMGRNGTERFAPYSHTRKGTKHHWQTLFLSGDPQACECSMKEKGSLWQWLLPKAFTRIPTRPGSIVSWSNFQTSISVFSPLLLFTCESPSYKHPESDVIILLCLLPRNSHSSPARWCDADTFACFADKCFIPQLYVIVQLLSFLFRLEGFLGRSSVLLGRGQRGL